MIGVVAIAALVMAACGGDDDSSSASDGADATADAGGQDGESSGDDEQPAAGGGSGGGTLVLGGETIAFDSARCFLEEQDAAAGGGKILFVAQAFGANAAGDEVAIDVSRYDEDSQFAGDDIIVDIGDPFGADAVSLTAKDVIGTVTVAGSDLSAEDLTFRDFDTGTEQPGSFEINC